MAEMGNVRAGFKDHEEVRMWHVPVVAMLMPKAEQLKVVAVYEDEGCLCIDVEEIKEEENE